MEFALGDWVTFNQLALKERDYKAHSAHWVAIPCGKRVDNVGVYVGYRHKQNGETKSTTYGGSWESLEPPEIASYFHETAPRTKVALVVVDARRNPKEVPFENLRHLEELSNEA